MTSEPVSPETSPMATVEQPVALDYVSQSAPGSPRNNVLPTHYLQAGNIFPFSYSSFTLVHLFRASDYFHVERFFQHFFFL